jgi:hypothetical protein
MLLEVRLNLIPFYQCLSNLQGLNVNGYTEVGMRKSPVQGRVTQTLSSYEHTHTHKIKHTFMHTHTNTHTFKYIHTNTHTFMDIHTNTHI